MADRNSKFDLDFQIAAWGLRVGNNRLENVTLDAQQWDAESEALLMATGTTEKFPMSSEANLGLVDEVLNQHLATQGKMKWKSLLGMNEKTADPKIFSPPVLDRVRLGKQDDSSPRPDPDCRVGLQIAKIRLLVSV